MNRVGPVLLFAIVLAAAPSTAFAERDTILTFAGGMSALGPLDPPDGSIGGPELVTLQLRGTVSWEEQPLPYKEPKGYNFAGTIVPEIFVGSLLVSDDQRDPFVGGGVRLEAMYSQRRMGLLEVSARGGFYLAGRAGLFADSQTTPLIEGAFGEYFLLGDSARIGFELGIMSIRTPAQENTPGIQVDGAVAGPPFSYDKGSYLDVNAALYLGVKM
jgi:hypothetical protein